MRKVLLVIWSLVHCKRPSKLSLSAITFPFPVPVSYLFQRVNLSIQIFIGNCIFRQMSNGPIRRNCVSRHRVPAKSNKLSDFSDWYFVNCTINHRSLTKILLLLYISFFFFQSSISKTRNQDGRKKSFILNCVGNESFFFVFVMQIIICAEFYL